MSLKRRRVHGVFRYILPHIVFRESVNVRAKVSECVRARDRESKHAPVGKGVVRSGYRYFGPCHLPHSNSKFGGVRANAAPTQAHLEGKKGPT